MRHAAVYGARQPFGFELCSHLLEIGYVVHAVDHQQWMREADEEKWLFVGRNANLKYYEIRHEDGHKLPFEVPKNCLIFIPVIDYVMRHVSQVADQLVRQLAAFSHAKEIHESCLFFIYPPNSNLNQAPFLKKLHGIYCNQQTNQIPVKNYCLSVRMEDPAFMEHDFKRQAERFLSETVETKSVR